MINFVSSLLHFLVHVILLLLWTCLAPSQAIVCIQCAGSVSDLCYTSALGQTAPKDWKKDCPGALPVGMVFRCYTSVFQSEAAQGNVSGNRKEIERACGLYPHNTDDDCRYSVDKNNNATYECICSNDGCNTHDWDYVASTPQRTTPKTRPTRTTTTTATTPTTAQTTTPSTSTTPVIVPTEELTTHEKKTETITKAKATSSFAVNDSSTTAAPESKGVSGIVVAGIVGGCLAAAGGVGYSVYWYKKRKKRKAQEMDEGGP